MENQYISKDGLEKLNQELENRTTVLRSEIALRIKEAKELGDLSESAEYSEAKEAQSHNEGRIEEVKHILENAVVIEGGKQSTMVNIGSRVKVRSSSGEEREFTIVGASESDPATGFISNESPLGKAFLGHKKGDTVGANTPKGLVKYEVLEIH